MQIRFLNTIAMALLVGILGCGGAIDKAPARPVAAPAREPESATGFRIDEIASGVYAAIRTDPPGLMVDANSVFIVNADDVVVVDAPEASAGLIDALRALTTKPVNYVINTHWHDDHIIGNAAWRKAYPAVRFIGHPALRQYLPETGLRNREAMIAGAPSFAGQMRAQMEKGRNLDNQAIDAEERASYAGDIHLVDNYMRAVPGTEVILPDIEPDGAMTLVSGQRRIAIQYLGRAHTSADLVVWLPDEQIAITGDLVVWPIPLVGGEQSHVGDWPATLDRLLALHPRLFVPGHGPVLRSADYPRLMRDLFTGIDTQVAGAVARGETLAAARKTVDLDAMRQRFAGDSRQRRFAFAMYVTGPAVDSAFRDAGKPGGDRQ